MKETMILTPLSDNQRRVFIDTVQLYTTYREVLRKSRSYKGGMHWKKSKGHQYLFRTRDRTGYGKSLGPRSPETEKILNDFQNSKKHIQQRLSNFKERIKEQARFCKAAMIQRVPRPITRILRLLDEQKLLGRNVMVIGTNAMYAYEAFAGVFFESSIMATGDMDILWDIRPRLSIAVDSPLGPGGLLGILKKSDRSFELLKPHSFQAVNKDGFLVDLIKAEPRDVLIVEQRRMGGKGDLEATEIKNLHWLLSSQKINQVVIGDDGFPAIMAVPDPRAFSAHKIWLSSQPDRNPIKKPRDRSQGLGVAQLVIQYLPQYPFKKSELKMFPKDVFESTHAQVSNIKTHSESEFE